MTCAASISTEREEELQKVWATSYDAWVSVPGAQHPVLYLCPVETQAHGGSAAATLDHAPVAITSRQPASCPGLQLPKIARDCALFSITAWNPFGEVRPRAENDAANAKLRAALSLLCVPGAEAAGGRLLDCPLVSAAAVAETCIADGKRSAVSSNAVAQAPAQSAHWSLPVSPAPMLQPSPVAIWPGFGFSAEHREDGYVVAFHREQAEAGRDLMLRLAVHFRQGAIYEFSPAAAGVAMASSNATAQPGSVGTSTLAAATHDVPLYLLLRKTLPAGLRHVASQQHVTLCHKPDMLTAEVAWQGA